MSTELIRITPGRPPFILVNGVRIFVAPHDEFHLATRREFKHKLREAHPDGKSRFLTFTRSAHIRRVGPQEVRAHSCCRNGNTYQVPALSRRAHTQFCAEKQVTIERTPSSAPFRRICAAYRRWLEEEKKWYAQFGLEPPRG